MGAGWDPVGIARPRTRGRAGTAWRRPGGRAGFAAGVANMAAQSAHFVVGLAPRAHRLIDQGAIAFERGHVGGRRRGQGLFRRRWSGGRREAWSRRQGKGNSKARNSNDRLRWRELVCIHRRASCCPLAYEKLTCRLHSCNLTERIVWHVHFPRRSARVQAEVQLRAASSANKKCLATRDRTIRRNAASSRALTLA